MSCNKHLKPQHLFIPLMYNRSSWKMNIKSAEKGHTFMDYDEEKDTQRSIFFSSCSSKRCKVPKKKWWNLMMKLWKSCNKSISFRQKIKISFKSEFTFSPNAPHVIMSYSWRLQKSWKWKWTKRKMKKTDIKNIKQHHHETRIADLLLNGFIHKLSKYHESLSTKTSNSLTLKFVIEKAKLNMNCSL